MQTRQRDTCSDEMVDLTSPDLCVVPEAADNTPEPGDVSGTAAEHAGKHHGMQVSGVAESPVPQTLGIRHASQQVKICGVPDARVHEVNTAGIPAEQIEITAARGLTAAGGPPGCQDQIGGGVCELVH